MISCLQTRKLNKDVNCMKHSIILALSVLIFGLSFKARAQTVQYVTLFSPNSSTVVAYPLQTNQVVSIVGFDWSSRNTMYPGSIAGWLYNGTIIGLNPSIDNGTYASVSGSHIPQIITGLTNITVVGGNNGYANAKSLWATLQITTPSTANVISNYVPADAIVIPTSATGNVQIILESSMDLVNWTAASPGTYSAASATNRFFRVRAVVGH
jgi:hypothetical protein